MQESDTLEELAHDINSGPGLISPCSVSPDVLVIALKVLSRDAIDS
jgi:hypothetical protein